MAKRAWLSGEAESSYTSYSAGQTLGWSFTPNIDMTITDIGGKPCQAGTAWLLHISDSLGNTLCSERILEANGYMFLYRPLTTPIDLIAGEEYTIWTECIVGPSTFYFHSSPSISTDISNLTPKSGTGGAVPVTNSGALRCMDFLYTPKAQAIQDFAYTGAVQSVLLQAGLYSFHCYGSASSDVESAYGDYNNRGGGVIGEIVLDQATTLYVAVGGNDSANFNGSKNGGRSNVYSGGGSDIRLVGGAWDDVTGLNSRIIVAGGAGSKGGPLDFGGYGGGLSGQTRGDNYGTGGEGGSQIAGGNYDAGFGYGGPGTAANGGYSGAGGGGYYGGGGSHPDISGDDDRGGGGGSGFLSGFAGCNAIISATDRTASGQANHYSGLVFTNGIMLNGERQGSGLVRIIAISVESLDGVIIIDPDSGYPIDPDTDLVIYPSEDGQIIDNVLYGAPSEIIFQIRDGKVYRI